MQSVTLREKFIGNKAFYNFDGNKYARCGKWDGIHLDAENHRKMGEAMAEWFKENV